MTVLVPRCRRSSPTGCKPNWAPAAIPSPPTATPGACCCPSPPAPVSPSRLDLSDLDKCVVAAFLDHLEVDRGNSVRTRNARLAAIHSLFTFAALQQLEHAALLAPGPRHPTQTPRPHPGDLPRPE